MDEKLLKETMDILNHNEENVYPLDASTDLLDHAVSSLDKEGVYYKKIPKKSKKGKNPFILRLYDNEEAFMDFKKGFYPNNQNIGKTIANDKFLTERFLRYSGVETPETRLMKEHEIHKAKEIIKSGDGHFVIKPKDLSHSLGAFRNVGLSNFKECWNKSVNIQKKYKIKNPIVILQKQVEGIELRVTVTEGVVDTVSMRAPGFVIGDGSSTIEELINEKNEMRKKNVYHHKNPLKINDDLKNDLNSRGNNLNTVLTKDEYLILYPRTNISIGRENYEVTEHVHSNIQKQALDAVVAIPGVHTAGVDIIVESLHATHGTVIEVNQNPAFQVNYFPMYGRKQDPFKKIFDSLLTENQILNERIDMKNLDNDKLDFILKRYKFLYNKTKVLENQIEKLLNEEK